MTPQRAIQRLEEYEEVLQSIASRFVRSENSLRVGKGDDSVFHQAVIEIKDLFDDVFGKNSYSHMIIHAYNEGIKNYFRTPSFRSVEQAKSIVSAARTRLAENPNVANKSEALDVSHEPATQEPLQLPEHVTLKWLYGNVPYRFWLVLGGLLVSAFLLGATAALRLSFVQQWFGVGSV
jgi:hypothetical protein